MQHGNLVLRYMRLCNLDQGDSVPIRAIIEYGEAEGFKSDDIQDALVRAGTMGWIVAIDLHIHLTKHGFTIIYPANDNADTNG